MIRIFKTKRGAQTSNDDNAHETWNFRLSSLYSGNVPTASPAILPKKCRRSPMLTATQNFLAQFSRAQTPCALDWDPSWFCWCGFPCCLLALEPDLKDWKRAVTLPESFTAIQNHYPRPTSTTPGLTTSTSARYRQLHLAQPARTPE